MLKPLVCRLLMIIPRAQKELPPLEHFLLVLVEQAEMKTLKAKIEELEAEIEELEAKIEKHEEAAKAADEAGDMEERNYHMGRVAAVEQELAAVRRQMVTVGQELVHVRQRMAEKEKEKQRKMSEMSALAETAGRMSLGPAAIRIDWGDAASASMFCLSSERRTSPHGIMCLCGLFLASAEV